MREGVIPDSTSVGLTVQRPFEKPNILNPPLVVFAKATRRASDDALTVEFSLKIGGNDVKSAVSHTVYGSDSATRCESGASNGGRHRSHVDAFDALTHLISKQNCTDFETSGNVINTTLELTHVHRVIDIFIVTNQVNGNALDNTEAFEVCHLLVTAGPPLLAVIALDGLFPRGIVISVDGCSAEFFEHDENAIVDSSVKGGESAAAGPRVVYIAPWKRDSALLAERRY